MHLSIHTRELDNGWVLDVEMNSAPSENPVIGRMEIHETYYMWGKTKERIVDLLEDIVKDLKQDITEKMWRPVLKKER